MTNSDTPPVTGAPWRSQGFRAVLAALSIAYVLVLNSLPISAAPDLQHDAGLFVALAERLRSFEWLGPYTEFTLAKGPGFPLWLALNSAIGLPLLVANGLLHLAGAWLLATAMVRLGTARWLAAAIFAIYLFNPAFAFREHLMVHREACYMAQVSLLIGLLALQVVARDRSPAMRAGGAAVLGIHVLFMWITREEGVWLLPGLAAAALAIILLDLLQRRPLRRTLAATGALAMLATAIVWGGAAGIAARNAAHYGVDAIVEFTHPAFVSAYGALTRVEHRAQIARVPVPRETMERIAAASPAFASLRGIIVEHGSGLIGEGCRLYGVVPCDGELRGGWFMWMVRHSLTATGHNGSGPAAMAFYARLADEINGACDRGLLRCGAVRRTFLPPFRAQYIRDAAGSAWVLLRQVLHYGSRFGGRPSSGTRPGIERFEALTLTAAWARGPQVTVYGRIDYPRGDRVALAVEPRGNLRAETAVDQRESAPGRTTEFRLRTDCLTAECRLTVYIDGARVHDLGMDAIRHGRIADRDAASVFVQDLEYDPTFAGPRAFLVRGGLAVADRLVRVYRHALPVAAMCVAFGLVAGIALAWRRRRVSPLLLLSLVVLALAASRLGLLAYLDATSFPARPYLGPMYPLLLAFIGLVAADLASHAGRRQRRSDAPVRNGRGT